MWQDLSMSWRVCLKEAWAAYCAESIAIGAAITDEEGNVIARGRNCIAEVSADGYALAGNRMAHAEMNALLDLPGQGLDPHTCTLWTTTEPCPMCIGAIRMVHIGRVCYASRDPVAGSAAFATLTSFMRHGEIEVVGPADETLELVLVALHAERLLHRGHAWAAMAEQDPACARGVRLGRLLFASGELTLLQSAGAPACQVLETMCRQLAEMN
jgi:tRNA(Arg) A34 adenosine deaminase TadA